MSSDCHGTTGSVKGIVDPNNYEISLDSHELDKDFTKFEKAYFSTINVDDKFILISTIGDMISEIAKEKVVYIHSSGLDEGVSFSPNIKDVYFSKFLATPIEISEVYDIPGSPLGKLLTPESYPVSYCNRLLENSKIINKLVKTEKFLFITKDKQINDVLEITSYVYYGFHENCFIFVLERDREKFFNFYEKNYNKLMSNSKERYSTDVFPEEALAIVPKLNSMFSDENSDVMSSFGYPTQFGIVLVGPPGTGKTMFINYLRSKIGLMGEKIYYDNYSINDLLWNVTHGHGLRMFGTIVLDDLDGVIAERHENEEGRMILPWLLGELDKFSSNRGVRRLVVMCVNSLDYVDPALIRPGRFDMIIKFSNPTEKIIINMVNHVVKHDPMISDETKNELVAFFLSHKDEISLATISLMGRLYYGKLVSSWEEAANVSVNRETVSGNMILKPKTSKVGF